MTQITFKRKITWQLPGYVQSVGFNADNIMQLRCRFTEFALMAIDDRPAYAVSSLLADLINGGINAAKLSVTCTEETYFEPENCYYYDLEIVGYDK